MVLCLSAYRKPNPQATPSTTSQTSTNSTTHCVCPLSTLHGQPVPRQALKALQGAFCIPLHIATGRCTQVRRAGSRPLTDKNPGLCGLLGRARNSGTCHQHMAWCYILEVMWPFNYLTSYRVCLWNVIHTSQVFSQQRTNVSTSTIPFSPRRQTTVLS